MGAGGILLAFLTSSIDDFMFRGGYWVSLNREVLPKAFVFFSSLAGLIVAIGGVLFSIMMTLLGRATAQYGPVVLRTYQASGMNKFVMGLQSAALLYIFTLFILLSTGSESTISYASLLGCGIFVTLTVCIVPIFIHYVSKLLSPAYLCHSIYEELQSHLAELEKREKGETTEKTEENEHKKKLLLAKETGYLLSVDKTKLVEIAKRENVTFYLPYKAGDFIVEEECLLQSDSSLEEKEELYSCFSFGEERMPIDDLEFYLEELASLIIKALSPGMNDVLVATKGVDYLAGLVGLILDRKFPNGRHLDEKQKLRLKSKEFSFENFVEAAYIPIRQNARNQPMILIRMLDTLHKIIEICQIESYKEILFRQANDTYKTAKEALIIPADLEDLEQRLKSIQESL